jgi:hypothetical protein
MEMQVDETRGKPVAAQRDLFEPCRKIDRRGKPIADSALLDQKRSRLRPTCLRVHQDPITKELSRHARQSTTGVLLLKRPSLLAESDTRRLAVSIDEELTILDNKLKHLKRDYEHYFLGSRPREPGVLRADVQKLILMHCNVPIQNTAARFRFNSINSRFQAFKRQWDLTLRQIEAGTYKRHVFKANLHDRHREATASGERERRPAQQGETLFDSYRDAAMACGQNVKGLTPAKLEAVIEKQSHALR